MGERGCELEGVGQKETPDEGSSYTTRAASAQVIWPTCPTSIHLRTPLSLPLHHPTPSPPLPQPNPSRHPNPNLIFDKIVQLSTQYWLLHATPATACIPLSIGCLTRRSEHNRHPYIAAASWFLLLPSPQFSVDTAIIHPWCCLHTNGINCCLRMQYNRRVWKVEWRWRQVSWMHDIHVYVLECFMTIYGYQVAKPSR